MYKLYTNKNRRNFSIFLERAGQIYNKKTLTALVHTLHSLPLIIFEILLDFSIIFIDILG